MGDSEIHHTNAVMKYLSQLEQSYMWGRWSNGSEEETKEAATWRVVCEILSQEGWLFLNCGTESVATAYLFVICKIILYMVSILIWLFPISWCTWNIYICKYPLANDFCKPIHCVQAKNEFILDIYK